MGIVKFSKQFDAPIEANLRRRVAGGFIVAVLLTIFMGFSSWWSTRVTADDAKWVAHTNVVMDKLHLTSNEVIEVETSAQIFALTGQEPLLAHYEAVRGTVALNDEPQVHAALDFAESLVAEREQLQTFPSTSEILDGQRLVDAVLATTHEMQAEETELLNQRTKKTQAGRRFTSFIIVAGIFVGAVLLGIARLAVNREIDVSARARAEITTLNAGLEQRVEERTGALDSEIVERKQAEEALKVSLATSELALKDLADQKFALDQHAIVAVTDVQGTISYVNEKFCAISQYSEEELIGNNHRILNSGHHPAEFFGQMYHTIANGEVWHDEIKNRAKDGSIYWVDTTIVPIMSKEGKPRQYIAIRADITDLKLAQEEVHKLNDELEHRVVERTAQLETANRELEAFSYSVSHDLRAPLRHISGFSKMLVEEFGATLDPRAHHYLERIQTGTQKMGLLVDELLNLARVGRHVLRPQPTRLNSIIAEVIAILQPDSEGRRIEWRIADLTEVECDPVLVKQVFQNLLANALKFTRPRARAVIEVSHKEEDGQPVFMVRDNGVGFSMKYVDKLFGVFQRLHSTDEFEGTGIGLVTVQRIVRKHGGRVWAEGEVDKGAAFYFTLGVEKQTESKTNEATAGGQS